MPRVSASARSRHVSSVYSDSYAATTASGPGAGALASSQTIDEPPSCIVLTGRAVHAGDLHRRGVRRRVEVARLVEHVVGRQEALAGDGPDAVALEERDGVEESGARAAVALGEPHQRGRLAEHGVVREAIELGPAAR